MGQLQRVLYTEDNKDVFFKNQIKIIAKNHKHQVFLVRQDTDNSESFKILAGKIARGDSFNSNADFTKRKATFSALKNNVVYKMFKINY